MSIHDTYQRAITKPLASKGDLSLQEQQARSHKSCPLCNKRFRWRPPRYRRPDGRPVDWVNAIGGHHLPSFVQHLAGAEVAECARCGGQWPVFAGGVEVIDETSRRELGNPNTKTIRNNDAGKLQRTTTIQHRWSQVVNLRYAHDTTVGIEAFALSAERAVKKHYELTLETELVETEQIEIAVKSGQASTVTWQPECVWRHGIVRMPHGKPIEYDARVAVNLLVDVAPGE
jgi:hypothetical protein